MMAEENKDIQKAETSVVDESTQDYIATIKKLKETTVDRQEYEKLKAEKKALLDEVINGKPIEDKEKVEVVPTIAELRKKIFSSDPAELGNLEFIQNALELRKQLILKGEPDPFLPYGKQITPEESDIQAANRVATVLQECVDYAQGDNGVFTNELQRRTVDVKIR